MRRRWRWWWRWRHGGQRGKGRCAVLFRRAMVARALLLATLGSALTVTSSFATLHGGSVLLKGASAKHGLAPGTPPPFSGSVTITTPARGVGSQPSVATIAY